VKKLIRILVLIVIVALVVWYMRSERRTPDGKLARHFDKLCKIAGSNIDSPERGVDRTFEYLGEHSPEMLSQLGETLVAIEQIGNDDKHDRRAREAARRLRAPLVACEETFASFVEAVGANPKARAKAERGLDRFGRTLEILFGAANRDAFREWLPR
jgi:hypothetical protein